MVSGSSALSRTVERTHTRSPWLMVTDELAKLRPAWRGSTTMSSSRSGEAPRANTVCNVLTDLPSWPSAPATIDWARSWPPKTTPWPLYALGAV
jgi:hypothetical protein